LRPVLPGLGVADDVEKALTEQLVNGMAAEPVIYLSGPGRR